MGSYQSVGRTVPTPYCNIAKPQSQSIGHRAECYGADVSEPRRPDTGEELSRQTDETNAKPRPSTALPSRTKVVKSVTFEQAKRERQRPQTCPPTGRRVTVEITAPPTLRTKPVRPRSSWLSPLQMTNVPPDAKLRYINKSEKERLSKLLKYTAGLLRNEETPLEWTDSVIRRLMSYKPELKPEQPSQEIVETPSLEEQRDSAMLKLCDLLANNGDDPRLRTLRKDITEKVLEKRLVNRDCLITSHVDPCQLGDQTTRALVAGFYLMLNQEAA